MPQLTQGQGSTPYEGANIFGAGVAGYETPVGTNLSPEAEHMLRAALIKQMTGIAKLKMEMAIQSITSSTNILVSVQRASTEAISSAVGMAQLGHLNNKRLGDLLLKITEASGAMRVASGHSYEEKSKNRILGAGGDLAKRQVAAGRSGSGPASTIDQIMATAVQENYSSSEIGNALVRMISANNNDFGRTVSSTIDELKASGADLVTIVDTKNLAKQQIAHGLDLAVQEAIDRLQQHGADPKHIQYIKENDLLIKKRSFYSGLNPADVKSITVNNIDQRTADKIRAEGSIKIEALSRFTQSLGVGVPRNLTDSLNKLVDISTSMVEDGPEAFAKSLYSMPTPLSVQLTEQKVQYQMDQLDNPTDPLSEAVARYASVIPYFSNYMAAMGMDDPLTAVEYLMEHPVDRQEYFNIIKVLTDTGKIDQINNPEALQERLRVAGSSDQDSIFRTSFLTKPLERLFGIGLNRPEAWRYFDGRNSTEQLENAIAALTAVGDERIRADIEATAKKNLADGAVIGAADESVEDGSGLEAWVVEEGTKGQPTKVAIELEGGLVGVYSTLDYASPDEAMAAANDGSGGVVVSYSTKAEEQRALKDSYQSQVPGYVRALSDDGADPTIEMERPNDPEPKNKYREFAENLPEGKREKALTAAEKYLKRLDPTHVRPGDTPKEGRYMLSGIEPEPVPVVKEEPAPAPVAPAKNKKTYPRMSTGYDQFGLKNIEEQVRKEREAGPVPVPVPPVKIDPEPTEYTEDQLKKQAVIKAKQAAIKAKREKLKLDRPGSK